MVNVFFSADINGVPHIYGKKEERGGIIVTDACDFDVAFIRLFRYEPGNDVQILYFYLLHSKIGEYKLADHPLTDSIGHICATDSVSAYMDFRSYPGDDQSSDRYELVPDPGNYVKVLYFDKRLRSIQGEFQAAFVRQNRVPNSPNATDTVRYTNGKFLLTNMYVHEVITEPR